MSTPKVWLTSMSSERGDENVREMIEPLRPHIDGIVWTLCDVAYHDPAARYLESTKGTGRIINRAWPVGRHHHAMNETLFAGVIQPRDLVIWTDLLERPAVEFVSRIKSEIGPLMEEADVDAVFGWGKAYVLRYRETMEYRGSPHWSLTGWNGRAIEWSTIEPDESKVRLNVRPQKRAADSWIEHYARYHVGHPAGSNVCALGLDHFPPGDRNAQFAEREARRLAFRDLMRARGVPLTVEGLKQLLTGPLDEELKVHCRAEKTLSDALHHWAGRTAQLKHSHSPADALPIP